MAKAAIALIVLLAAFFGFFKTRALKSADMKILRFTPCPDNPNCVSSDSPEGDAHYFPSFPFTKPLAEAKKILREKIEGLDRVTLSEDDGAYLHYEFRSWLFSFIDDVEFEFNESTHMVRVKSASRVGKSDLGVNRKRMEKIQALLKDQI